MTEKHLSSRDAVFTVNGVEVTGFVVDSWDSDLKIAVYKKMANEIARLIAENEGLKSEVRKED